MIKKINLLYIEILKKLKAWAVDNILGLFILNISLIVLLLLRSGGYFLPFFLLDGNIILFFGLIIAILFLKIRSNVIFIITIFFWLFAAFLRITEINILAEKVGIYVFETFILALFIFILERISSNSRSKQ